MRRKDREVTAISEILAIVEECKVCRIGMMDEDGIYIVPLNFGYEYQDGQLILYFHGAKEGRKLDAIKKKPNVCIEMDCDHHLEEGEKACQYAYGFKSIIGNGRAAMVTDIEEKKSALALLMKHQTGKAFSFNEQMTEAVAVFKVCVTRLSGKYHK